MRILLGYNGSEASRAAIYDLHNAGLSGMAEALVLTTAEEWNFPHNSEEARKTADDGVALIKQEFPTWTVAGETASGSPPREILARAESFAPDLIVVGEPRHDLNEHNLFVGHTSHVLLTEAECSVRIARGDQQAAERPQRILVGFDGSAGSTLSVQTIASRRWAPGTTVELLAVADSSVLGLIGRFNPAMRGAAVEVKFASQWAETLASRSLAKLNEAGISSSVEVLLGHPKDVIIEEAERAGVDTIFVGPHCSSNSFERFLIGSVSASVAARAHCSVEVVRGRACGA
jgi:nucleotide-binding universal stress UspA family protein